MTSALHGRVEDAATLDITALQRPGVRSALAGGVHPSLLSLKTSEQQDSGLVSILHSFQIPDTSKRPTAFPEEREGTAALPAVQQGPELRLLTKPVLLAWLFGAGAGRDSSFPTLLMQERSSVI